jgi:hypothetical protein
MNRDRAYPLTLVAMLLVAAAIATALVGHSREAADGSSGAHAAVAHTTVAPTP